MKQPLVQLQNVQLRNDRGDFVFRDLNFTLQPEQSAVIAGSAGSGKTTLVELLTGVRFASVGSVEVFGHLLKKGRRSAIRKVRRQIGGIGGPFGLMPLLSVAENITLPLVLAGLRKKDQRERLFKVLTEYSLLKQASEYPPSLTRVENTLTQFARASIANQPLLIIDEPMAGLDKNTWERVHQVLQKVALSGRSMLILTSDLPSQELPQTTYYQLVNGVLQ
ncbi:ATP-binding cassette domain-containing protein [bacterium]|nr:ATP-binding cassette domain-containing protein [bacterium]